MRAFFLLRRHFPLGAFLRATGVVALTLIVCVGATVTVDQYLHVKFDEAAGLNYRGYRGKIVGDKQPSEYRIGIFGGSVAMGYGVAPDQSAAAHLERQLSQVTPTRHTVVNLAATGGASAAFFADNYRQFNYLQLDSVVFLWYEAESGDIEQLAPSERSSDPIFRHLNYWFILKVVMWEKYFLLRYGDIAYGYKNDPIQRWAVNVFAPNRLPLREAGGGAATAYKLADLVRDLLDDGREVYFLLYPFKNDPGYHVAFQMYMDDRFGDDVPVIDLYPVFDDGSWDNYFLDGLHLTSRGNARVAEALLREMRRRGLVG